MSGIFISQQRRILATVQRLADATCIIASLYLSQWIVGQMLNEHTLVVSLAASTFFLLVGELNSLYSQDRTQTADRELHSSETTCFGTLC
ncbi:MAG: hypothetical protein IT423_19015, partial [Pirellulaceae bacterium]|nr:hypothetical protein [Pirellulaceae bacterium]